MKSLENIISMIIIAAILLLMPVVIAEAHFSRCLSITGRSSAEELASQISREKVLTTFNYNQHADELYKCGYEGELQVSFYTYEMVADGAGQSQKVKYVTTWDEIKAELLVNQVYYFPDNAYVDVTARAYMSRPSSFKLFVQTRTDYTASAYIERGYAQ